MKQICKFNKKRDFVETKPNLSVNLSQALESKAIPSTGTEVEHNEIDTSDGVGMRVRDNFEAIEAQRLITAQGKAQAKAEKAAKAKAEADAKAKSEQAQITSTQQNSAEGAN